MLHTVLAGGLMILYIFVTCFCIKLCEAHCELKLGNYLFLLKLTVFLSNFWFWIWVWKSHWWGRDFQDLMLSKTTIDTSAHKENLLMFISEYYCNLTKKKKYSKKVFILVEKQELLKSIFFGFRKGKQKHFETLCSLYTWHLAQWQKKESPSKWH